MAAPTSAKVSNGSPVIGGPASRAPIGTAVPTDVDTTLNAAFVNQGYVHADGFTRTIDKAYESVNALGGDEVLKARSSHSVSMSFTLLQSLDSDVLETVFGADAVTVTAATATEGERIAVAYEGEELPNSAWVFDFLHNSRMRRIVFPNAQLTTESFEQTFTDGDAVPMPVELTVYKDDSGVYFYDYTDDGVTTA